MPRSEPRPPLPEGKEPNPRRKQNGLGPEDTSDYLNQWFAADQEHLLSFMEENISDMSCAVSAASVMDRMMTIFFLLHLSKKPSKKQVAEVFEGHGALSDFSKKIEVSYFMNFITAEVRDNLNTIRAIRNRLCHSIRPLKFEDTEIVTLCDRLSLSPTYPDLEENLKIVIQQFARIIVNQKPASRHRFVSVSLYTFAVLLASIQSVQTQRHFIREHSGEIKERIKEQLKLKFMPIVKVAVEAALAQGVLLHPEGDNARDESTEAPSPPPPSSLQ